MCSADVRVCLLSPTFRCFCFTLLALVLGFTMSTGRYELMAQRHDYTNSNSNERWAMSEHKWKTLSKLHISTWHNARINADNVCNAAIVKYWRWCAQHSTHNSRCLWLRCLRSHHHSLFAHARSLDSLDRRSRHCVLSNYDMFISQITHHSVSVYVHNDLSCAHAHAPHPSIDLRRDNVVVLVRAPHFCLNQIVNNRTTIDANGKCNTRIWHIVQNNKTKQKEPCCSNKAATVWCQ